MQIFQYFFLKFPEFSTITKRVFATIFLKLILFFIVHTFIVANYGFTTCKMLFRSCELNTNQLIYGK